MIHEHTGLWGSASVLATPSPDEGSLSVKQKYERRLSFQFKKEKKNQTETPEIHSFSTHIFVEHPPHVEQTLLCPGIHCEKGTWPLPLPGDAYGSAPRDAS